MDRATGELFKTLISRGYPFAVIVVAKPRGSLVVHKRVLSLADIDDLLESVHPSDIRLKPVFDPIHFENPYQLPYYTYGYPLKTLYEEYYRLGMSPVFEFYEPSEDARVLYQTHFGFAIIDDSGHVLGYLIEKPLVARHVVIIIPDTKRLVARAYTADRNAVSVLLRHGYKSAGKYVYSRRYSSLDEMYRDIYALKNECFDSGIFAFTPRAFTREMKAYVSLPA
jgi:hypothetical protein